ncbi:MAG TPA: DUF1297 domain-containing protein [Candidatus Nanoarchaeia archaeon]|nr:DUF1297 domain-containing protein [Candidatus Nanoarchaeia archaeon]
MIDVSAVLKNYDLNNLTIGTLGGHSALDVCYGAKKLGLKTVVVAQKGREKTYERYYKTHGDRGIVDHVIVVDKFADIISVQDQLRKLNTLFVHSRYFWVYCSFHEIENNFYVPIIGNRALLKAEERTVPNNQYVLLQNAGIRFPRIFTSKNDIDRLVLVKANEAQRSYERAFFLASSPEDFDKRAAELLNRGVITSEGLHKAVIEEYVVGAAINFNYFYSPLSGKLELMGTDMRRQTNIDGILRLPAPEQIEVLRHVQQKFVETGHVAVTIKESLLEKVFELGERFVKVTQELYHPGILGGFALQGAVVAEHNKEDIVIFDCSLRIPGSPGSMFTPYSGYLHGTPMSYGERIAKEVKDAVRENKLGLLCT